MIQLTRCTILALVAVLLPGCQSEVPTPPSAPKVSGPSVQSDLANETSADTPDVPTIGAPAAEETNGGLPNPASARDGEIDLVASAQPPATLQLTEGTLVTRIQKTDSLSGLSNLVFSPDGKLLYVADSDAGIVVLSVPSWEKTATWTWAENNKKTMIEWLVLSHDGGTLVAGHQHGLITVWSTAKGEIIHRHEYVPAEDSMGPAWALAHGLAITPDGKRVASADGGSFGYSIWTSNDGKELWRQTTEWRDVKPADFHPNGKTVALLGVKRFLLCDAETGKPTLTVPLGRSLIDTALFTPDGQHILVDYDGKVEGKYRCVCGMLDATSGKLEWCVDSGYDSQYGIDVSPDGSLVAIVGQRLTPEGFAEQKTTVQFRNAKDGQLKAAFQSRVQVAPKASFSPDGKLLAVGDEIWQVPETAVNSESKRE
jgi:WD40 repeat protein